MENLYRRHLESLIATAVEINEGVESYSNQTCASEPASTSIGHGNRDTAPPSLNKLKTEIFSKLGISDFSDPGKNFHSDVVEEATATGSRQLLYDRLTRDNRLFMIEEAVVNFLGEHRALPYSMLAIIDLESGKSLDLAQFLPSGCTFTPSRLLKVKVDFDRHRRRMTSEFFHVNLKTYPGMGSEGDFYFNRKAGRVAYGNLTTEGALLFLFHEIAHTWQFAFQGKSAKRDFSTLFSYLSLRLHNLGVRMEAHKQQAISEERFHHFIGLAKEKLAEKNIALDTDSVINGNQSPQAGSIIFKAHSGKRFFFKSRAFVEALGEYMQVERDAWAFAILAIRLLRKKGFDLEPELCKLEDFKTHIHPHLENYQNSINSQIEMDGEKLCLAAKKTRAATRV